MDDFFEAMECAGKIVALTGAGVSTLSGIRDFRGEDGVYVKSPTWNGIPVESMLDTDFFVQYPELFYKYAREHLYPMTEKEPSIAHHTLAMLEQKGILDMLYTQNIDLLHSKAGSRKVGEFHGSFRGHHCIRCGKNLDLQSVYEEIKQDKCPSCFQCGGIVKPNVVFYGDSLDEELLNRAFHDFETADIAIVMGTSLTVQPVAGLPMATVVNRKKLLIVNAQPTEYDCKATWIFRDIADFCRKVQAHFECYD